MAVYTVHEPLSRDGARSAPERFVFVRDGFSFWALQFSKQQTGNPGMPKIFRKFAPFCARNKRLGTAAILIVS